MGWASGSILFAEVIDVLQKAIPDKEARKVALTHLIDCFEEADWDTLDECLGQDPVYDEIYNERYPPEDDY